MSFINFTSGAIMMAFAMAGLFFARFWSRTRDSLFGIFAAAFLMMAFERWMLLMVDIADETRTWVYLIRLVAFVCISAGIVVKNRET